MKLFFLVEREIKENKMNFKIPLIIGILSILFNFTANWKNQDFIYESNSTNLFISNHIISGISSNFAFDLSGVLFLFLFITYISCTLPKERKNGSYMFWRSMPVSNSMHLISKLAYSLIVLPFYCLLLFLSLELSILIKYTFAHWGNIVFQEILSFFIFNLLNFLKNIFFTSIVLFPLASLFLVVSQITKRPIVIVIIASFFIFLFSSLFIHGILYEYLLHNYFSLSFKVITSEHPYQEITNFGLNRMIGLLFIGFGLFLYASKLYGKESLSRRFSI